MLILVVNESTKTNEIKEVLSKHGIFQNDIAEDRIYTLPGFESIPLEGDTLLKSKLSSGDDALFLVPLKSEIKPGERRIFATDENGSEKSSLFMDKDGNVKAENAVISITIDKDGKYEIKGSVGDLTAFIHELANEFKGLVTSLSTATVPTAIGPQLLSIAPDLIAKIPTLTLLVNNINSFKK